VKSGNDTSTAVAVVPVLACVLKQLCKRNDKVFNHAFLCYFIFSDLHSCPGTW
jgi:hypothetical protein